MGPAGTNCRAACPASGGPAWGGRGHACRTPGLPVSRRYTGKGPKNQTCEEKNVHPARPIASTEVLLWTCAAVKVRRISPFLRADEGLPGPAVRRGEPRSHGDCNRAPGSHEHGLPSRARDFSVEDLVAVRFQELGDGSVVDGITSHSTKGRMVSNNRWRLRAPRARPLQRRS